MRARDGELRKRDHKLRGRKAWPEQPDEGGWKRWPEPALSFAGLLRQFRTEARLTQEELAEAAGLSPRSVSDLERGVNRTARKDTALLLADALSLAGQVRVLFVAAARGRAPGRRCAGGRRDGGRGARGGGDPDAARDIGSFTGREAELARLLGSLASAAADGGLAGIHVIDGMAGIGKTTFAVHAAHRLAGSFPDGQFFLPLHAHTPGQRPVSPADALASLLLTAGVAEQHIPPGLEARAGRWRDHVAGKKILLLLDDAAGHEQVRPLLPGTAGSLVLITSRRRLTALEDATVISLDTLSPDEAAALLARLAGRPDLAPGGPGRADNPAVRVPAAGDRDARPGSCGTTRPGPARNWPLTWRRRATGWPSCAPRTCRSRPRSTCPTRPHRGPAAAVPPARPGAGPGHRRLRRGRARRHQRGERPRPAR